MRPPLLSAKLSRRVLNIIFLHAHEDSVQRGVRLVPDDESEMAADHRAVLGMGAALRHRVEVRNGHRCRLAKGHGVLQEREAQVFDVRVLARDGGLEPVPRA